ncbi:MAG TPA: protease inhibitor I42 family protein [Burkholderiales bacterium]|nr:protease inhibitor I42 family protein [Burkholderiales bacterium]
MNALALGPQDRGREVPVRVGDRIVLRLPENPTTGFRWAGDIPAFLQVERDANESSAAPGAGGMRILELSVRTAGRAELRLVCGRSWDPSAPPTDRFNVMLQAQ